jgi:predicted nucleic acid-binding protein
MRVLLDTNILLGLYLARNPFFKDASAIIAAHHAGGFQGYVASITPLNLYYVARKYKGDQGARTAVQLLLSSFGVVPVNHALLQSALFLDTPDYEDAVEIRSAALWGLDAIVTRDTSGFRTPPLPVYHPTDFLNRL